MSEPTDAEWEAASDNLESEIWDHYRRQELEREARREDDRADRAAKILLTVFIVLLLAATLFAAQTELRL